MQVSDDPFGQNRSAYSGAVDLKISHDPLNVVPRFPIGDGFDPIYDVDAWVSRIAELPHPARGSRWPGVLGRNCQDVGPVEPSKNLPEICPAKLYVAAGIPDQAVV